MYLFNVIFFMNIRRCLPLNLVLTDENSEILQNSLANGHFPAYAGRHLDGLHPVIFRFAFHIRGKDSNHARHSEIVSLHPVALRRLEFRRDGSV
jgi:hypothetical protein